MWGTAWCFAIRDYHPLWSAVPGVFCYIAHKNPLWCYSTTAILTYNTWLATSANFKLSPCGSNNTNQVWAKENAKVKSQNLKLRCHPKGDTIIFRFALLILHFLSFRVRSPLLTESRLIYFPHATEMFHFAWFPLFISHDIKACRLPRHRFPHSDTPGSKLVYQLPEAFRKVTASFVGFYCLGIHRIPFSCFNFPIQKV